MPSHVDGGLRNKRKMELEIIKHSDISQEDLLRIIDIKNAAWPHPIESQLKWIADNQSSEDLHVILKEGGEDLAYMDLCPVMAMVDGHYTSFVGIGNVCTKEKGKGHGGELMKLVNKYIVDNNLRGMLFCMDRVVRFYANYSWQLIPSDSVIIEGEGHEGIYTMCFNIPSFNRMIYSDRLF